MIDTSPVFIAGAGRSGTTLVADMLGLHPRISPIYETGFVIGVMEMLFKPSQRPPARQAAHLTKFMKEWTKSLPLRPHNKGDHERYHHGPHYVLFDQPFAMARTEELAAAVLTGESSSGFRAFLLALFMEHCRLDHKPRWVNKTPAYVHQLPLLLRLFPTMRFIHCVRDGRDVACSVTARPWGPKTHREAADWWAGKAREAAAFQKKHPQRCLLVRYEDVLQTPEETLGRILAWLGEEGDPAEIMRHYQDEGVRLDPSRIGQWTETFSREDIAAFDELAGDLLAQFGYPSGAPPIAAEFREFLSGQVRVPEQAVDLQADLPLGAEGVGLDSVATVELLLACEQRWSIPFPAALLERPPVTVGRLIHHLEETRK